MMDSLWPDGSDWPSEVDRPLYCSEGDGKCVLACVRSIREGKAETWDESLLCGLGARKGMVMASFEAMKRLR